MAAMAGSMILKRSVRSPGKSATPSSARRNLSTLPHDLRGSRSTKYGVQGHARSLKANPVNYGALSGQTIQRQSSSKSTPEFQSSGIESRIDATPSAISHASQSPHRTSTSITTKSPLPASYLRAVSDNSNATHPSRHKTMPSLSKGSPISSQSIKSLTQSNTTYIKLLINNYSSHRTNNTSRPTHSIRDLPASTKSLSSHTVTSHSALTAEKAIPQSLSTTTTMPKPPPLSLLPLKALIRGIATSTVSSSPVLLPPSLKVMSILAHSNSALLNPDRNPILRWFLKHTFYAQFCAGENATEVKRTVDSLKAMGCKGVMLCYAKEVVLDDKEGEDIAKEEKVDVVQDEILTWKKGTMETVTMMVKGDFVALKFTGAGSQALQALAKRSPPSKELHEAITGICDLAAERGVRLLFDAEQALLQPGVDIWTLDYMRRYNGREPGNAVIYSTYQAYLKRCPEVLAKDLAVARKEGFTVGVKLVRGAYLASDPRHLIHDTKADTDNAYDSIAESVLRRQYGSILRPAVGEENEPFPEVSMVLAGHNLESVRKAQIIRNTQAEAGEKLISLEYAQLQGMADEVSCELLQASQAAREKLAQTKGSAKVDPPLVYKYLVWGTTGECMKYLLRRAQENKDAVGRTREGRNAMAAELIRRMMGVFKTG